MTSIWSGVSPLALTFTAAQGVALTFTTVEARVDLIGTNILRIQGRLLFTSTGTPGVVFTVTPVIEGITWAEDNRSIPLGRYNFADVSTGLKQVGNALWNGTDMNLNFQANNTLIGTALGTDPAITVDVGDGLNFLAEMLID